MADNVGLLTCAVRSSAQLIHSDVYRYVKFISNCQTLHLKTVSFLRSCQIIVHNPLQSSHCQGDTVIHTCRVQLTYVHNICYVPTWRMTLALRKPLKSALVKAVSLSETTRLPWVANMALHLAIVLGDDAEETIPTSNHFIFWPVPCLALSSRKHSG